MDQRKPTQRHGAEVAAQMARNGSACAGEDRNARSAPRWFALGGERVSSSPDYTDAAYIRQLHQGAAHEQRNSFISSSWMGDWSDRRIRSNHVAPRLSNPCNAICCRSSAQSKLLNSRCPSSRIGAENTVGMRSVGKRTASRRWTSEALIVSTSHPLPCSLGGWLVGQRCTHVSPINIWPKRLWAHCTERFDADAQAHTVAESLPHRTGLSQVTDRGVTATREVLTLGRLQAVEVCK